MEDIRSHLDPRRRELDRILQSDQFARAGKLRQLITWLAERAIGGDATKPSEYFVGVEALGKPADFDPSYDVSVRQLKRRLCARLANYYETAGRASTLRLVCDRGFAVRFERVSAPSPVGHCVAVLPLHGDDSGFLLGALSHAFLEAGAVRVIGRAAVLAEAPALLASRFGVTHLVEGELYRLPGESWQLALRLIDAGSGTLLTGLRVSGDGPVAPAALTTAASSLLAPLAQQ